MVIHNGETKVAQYGQWDGYPEGQGATALNFLLNTDIDAFKKNLEKVRFANDADEKEQEKFLASIGCKDGWMTSEQSAKFDAKYPYHTRDHGAEILALIMKAKGEVVLNDNTAFAADSLFCEWAYVIDLDKQTFEVYRGFHKSPLKKKDRFFSLQTDKREGYYPVKLAASFNINELPTESAFIAKFTRKKAKA